MNVKILEIRIGSERIGVLFQYAPEGAQTINRFVVDQAFAERRNAPLVSLSFLAASEHEQHLFWQDVTNPAFNGALAKDRQSWLLPAFFQNLLPEGMFRDQIAAARGCAPNDHFELLAACGKDLPGNIYALPVEVSRHELGRYVTQNADALEITVTAEPLTEGVSLSGVQPKLGVIKKGDRYVARTRDEDTHIIAKLPVPGMPLLPEVEELSLRLARAAGVQVCHAYLEPLHKLAAQHHYDLGETDAQSRFLAVVRYDRSHNARIHCEDFAQIFGIMPEDKYSPQASYLAVAATLLQFPSLGEPAVHELLRRMVVNEMLGNPDMHLKNIGLWYPDGKTPELPPAYDIVAHALYAPVTGHGLRILPAELEASLQPKNGANSQSRRLSLRPTVLREFCNQLKIPERPAAKALSQCVKAAYDSWPQLIEQSALTASQKTKLLARFHRHPMVESLARRKR